MKNKKVIIVIIIAILILGIVIAYFIINKNNANYDDFLHPEIVDEFIDDNGLSSPVYANNEEDQVVSIMKQKGWTGSFRKKYLSDVDPEYPHPDFIVETGVEYYYLVWTGEESHYVYLLNDEWYVK